MNTLPYYRKLTPHEIKMLEINATKIDANLMINEFRINKINAKDIKGNSRDYDKVGGDNWTNLFQHRKPRNLKLSHVPKSHILSRKTMLTIRHLSWPKSKEKTFTSLLTATTMKMNSKYCKTSP